jgi:hypothetical protein
MDAAAIKVEFDRRLFAAYGADQIGQFLKIQPKAFPMAVAYVEARRSGLSDFDVIERGLKTRPYQQNYRVWALVLSIASDFLPMGAERNDYGWFQTAFTIAELNDREDWESEVDRVLRIKSSGRLLGQ